MAILNFMPQFAPWYTKDLLKKKDDPDAVAATESSTGFFGDVFDFIDDGFDWAATTVQEPAQPYIEDYPAYDVPPQYDTAPAPSYEPTVGFGAAIGDAFNGSGEGMGFDMLSEPTDSWSSQYPSPAGADWGSEIGGGMGFDPSFPPAYTPPVPAPTYGFGEGIGDQFSSYFDWNSEFAPDPTPYMPPPDWGSMDIQATEPPLMPQGEQQPWMNFDFPDFGNTLTDWADPAPRYEDAVPMENLGGISSGLMDQPAPDPMGWADISTMFNDARPEREPAPQTWDIPGMENPNTGIPGWASMSADERGEYVWQSGLDPESYLTDMDMASLSPDVRFKLNFSTNDRANFMGDVNWSAPIGKKLWDAGQTVVAQPGEFLGDLSLDPVKSMLDPENYNLDINVPTSFNDLLPERGEEPQPLVSGSLDFQYPLQDTISNIRSADNPWDFAQSQGENFYDRPLAEQIALAYLAPGGGSGLYGSLGPVGLFDKAVDFAQGGFVSDIPGAGSFVKNVAFPGGGGAIAGLATEAIFDPKYTYTDPITGETTTIDPNYWQMAAGFGGTAILGKNVIGRGLMPGNSIDDVSKNVPLSGVRWKAENTLDSQAIPRPLGKPTYGLPGVKGAKKQPVKLVWDDPIDQALYQASSGSSSKESNALYRAFIDQDFDRADIDEAGFLIRQHIASATRNFTGGETLRVPKIIRATADEAGLSTVPRTGGDIAGEAISETPQERITRLTEELRLSNPEAAASSGFFPQNLVSPSVADEGLSTIPTGIVDEAVTPAPSTPLVERALEHADAIDADRALDNGVRAAKLRQFQSDVNRSTPSVIEAKLKLKDVNIDTYASWLPRFTDEEAAQLTDVVDKNYIASLSPQSPIPPFGAPDRMLASTAIRKMRDGLNPYENELDALRRMLTNTPWQKAADDATETIAPKADGIARRPNARIVDDAVEPGMDGPLTKTLDEIGTARIAPEDEAIIGADDALFPEFKPSGIERTNINDRGSFQTSLGSVDETAQYRSPGAPVIGEDDPLQRRLPLWGEADKTARPDEYPFSNPRPDAQARTPNEAVKAVDAWQADVVERGKGMQPDALNRFLDEELARFVDENGSDVASMAKLARAQVPSRIQKQALGEWQAPFSQAMPSGVPTDIPTESGALVSKRAAEMADVAPSNIDSVPAVIRPVVEEWEQKALNAVKGLPMTKRADELDKMQLELSRSLRGQVPDGTAVSQAERSRDRVVYALNRQDKAEVDAGLADWRETNTKDFDAIDVNAKSSWAERRVGGALKNKLADTLTSRGRDLDMYFQKQGYTFEESKDMVERELADYLNGRMVREAKNGNKDAILEHALTALHMGDFQPKIDGVEVPTGTGQVPGAIQFARTTNSALKNMFFGIADVGAIMGNAVPAIMNQGPMVGLAILNRMFKLVDLEDALKNREFSGLAMDQSQDVMSEDVGTLIGWAGRALGDKKGGAALRAIDRPFTKWNDVLSKAQFDLLMNKGLRQPAYEGNLVLLKLLGRDVNDPTLQRAAARMANAATSTAPLARGNTRRAAEGATLSSARYLRAQGDLLLAATKLINPKASLDERIIAASAISSVIAVSAIANELAGNRLDLNPFKGVNVNPWKGDIDIKGAEFNPDFGKITLPDGTVVPFFRQKELAQTLLKSVAELDDLAKKDPTGIRDAWSRFIIGRTGPLGGTALKGLAKTGYDPVENTYSFPWEGEGFGSGMSPTQYALRMTPAPVGLLGLFDNKGTKLSKELNIIGGGTYPQGDYSAALKKYGVDSMEEFEKLDPDTFMTRKEKLYQENPELRAKFADTAGAKIEESKKLNSEDFMNGNRKIAQWRTRKDELAANAAGVYGELGLEEKERPEKDGAAQWAWDYNQTFANAKADHSNEFSETNRDVLGKLQAEFWAAHPDPKVRKEILDYQILKAPTEADKLFAKDMARLNGINPDTGEALTYPNGKPMPNFFTMDKYIWKEVPNDEAEEFRVGFDSWKNRQKGKVLELSVDKQIELYIETSKDVQTRANGKQWTPAAIKDVQNYGDKSKIRPIYTSYEEEMLPELLWFKPKQEWATIKEAHDNRE